LDWFSSALIAASTASNTTSKRKNRSANAEGWKYLVLNSSKDLDYIQGLVGYLESLEEMLAPKKLKSVSFKRIADATQGHFNLSLPLTWKEGFFFCHNHSVELQAWLTAAAATTSTATAATSTVADIDFQRHKCRRHHC
jgi:hypothetical protein